MGAAAVLPPNQRTDRTRRSALSRTLASLSATQPTTMSGSLRVSESLDVNRESLSDEAPCFFGVVVTVRAPRWTPGVDLSRREGYMQQVAELEHIGMQRLEMTDPIDE